MENMEDHSQELLSFAVFNIEESFASHIQSLLLSELLARADRSYDSNPDETIETSLYLDVNVFLKTSSVLHLTRAVRYAEKWSHSYPMLDHERERRLKICRMLIGLDR